MINRDELVSYINKFLKIDIFHDYCPNGLQIEGKPTIQTIVTGVTGNLALIEKAIAQHADLMLVHHGLFWKKDPFPIVGLKKARFQKILNADLNVMAYHLPLDSHLELGNNAQLAKFLNIHVEGQLVEEPYVWFGEFAEPISTEEFSQRIFEKLGRLPLHIAGTARKIKKIAWCSGGGQDFIEKTLSLGIDCYFSGEISESTVHIAREAKIHYFAAGHHATERYGIKALGEHLAEKFQLNHHFIDIENPV